MDLLVVFGPVLLATIHLFEKHGNLKPLRGGDWGALGLLGPIWVQREMSGSSSEPAQLSGPVVP